MMQIFRISICITAVVSIILCDVFSSTARLKHLLHLEKRMVTVLHDYVTQTEEQIASVKGYLDNFYKSYNGILNGNTFTSGDQMVENPLQAFQLIKRLSVEWDTLKSIMETNHWELVLRLTKQYEQLMPSEEDLQGAALALVHLQKVYKLEIEELYQGETQGFKSEVKLTAQDLLYLGIQSFSQGYYTETIRWIKTVMNTVATKQDGTIDLNDFHYFLEEAIREHDELFKRTDIDLDDFDVFDGPVGNRSIDSLKLYEGKTPNSVNGDISVNQVLKNYSALCRGEKLRTPQQEALLTCRLETRGNPFLLIQPVKTEQMSWDPYIVQFHGLLTDSQMEIIRKLAEPTLSRSMVGYTEETVSDVRISQTAYFSKRDHSLMARIFKLVEIITGLSTDVDKNHAETAQIANYGIGGRFDLHYDHFLVNSDPELLESTNPREIDAGDRTATLMFYLSDVKRGGATVFPMIGAGIWPIKGSAVFWYNLKKNGLADMDTLHSGCPVLNGNKWIANFWIREKGQVFRRRCDLNSDL